MWPGSIVVKKPADARRTVDEIKAGGADFIKVYDGVPRDAYFALADEAKLQHIDFEGHVPEAVTAQEASATGQRSMEHKSRERWEERTQPQIRRWNNLDYQMARGIFGVEEKIVGGMYQASVPLMAGTDAMNPYCLPGFSLHDELALMVDSGLSPPCKPQRSTLLASCIGRPIWEALKPAKAPSMVRICYLALPDRRPGFIMLPSIDGRKTGRRQRLRTRLLWAATAS